jgi:hypothetical protein
MAVPVLEPERALAVCGGALEMGVAAGYYRLALRARQPFDFAAGGRVALEVDAFDVGDGWMEVWITDLPTSGPGSAYDGMLPRNGLGFLITSCGPIPGYTVSEMRVVRDYVESGMALDSECVEGELGVLNRFELRLGATQLEVWASDAGDPDSFRRVADAFVEGWPLTRGYLQLQRLTTTEEPPLHRWDNVGFDGPRLVTPRGYDVPDSLVGGDETAVNLGYYLTGTGERLEVGGVEPDGAASAHLDFSSFNHAAGAAFEYRLNVDVNPANPWTPMPDPAPAADGGWHLLSVPVDPTLLVAGANTIDLRADDAANLVVVNVGLTLEP